jgi:hypothetical protein
VFDQPAAANAAGDAAAAAEDVLARLITDNDPAARAAVADALHLRAAHDNPPSTNSTPDTL